MSQIAWAHILSLRQRPASRGCSLSVADQRKKCLCSEFRVPTFYEDQFPLQGFDS